MDLFEIIEKRHSYRDAFLDKPVPREDLELIVGAGLRAPSGKNAQTTRFIIVDDSELVHTIGHMHATNKSMQQARALIVCIIDRAPDAIYEGHSFQIEDCAAAVENMLLAITCMGYATVWIDGWLRLENRAEKIGQLLNVPGSKIIRVLLPVGVPAKNVLQKEKLPFTRRAWFNRYPAEPQR